MRLDRTQKQAFDIFALQRAEVLLYMVRKLSGDCSHLFLFYKVGAKTKTKELFPAPFKLLGFQRLLETEKSCTFRKAGLYSLDVNLTDKL